MTSPSNRNDEAAVLALRFNYGRRVVDEIIGKIRHLNEEGMEASSIVVDRYQWESLKTYREMRGHPKSEDMEFAGVPIIISQTSVYRPPCVLSSLLDAPRAETEEGASN